MKKLMSLLFLGFAAFAGGGLMNEHNMTTMVNYLYHKQQVGTVINLGAITDSPPADIPSTLPTVPGAVPTPAANKPESGVPESLPAGSPGNSQVANTAASNPAVPGGTTHVPASAPPPISVKWPDQTVSTFRSTPASPEDRPAAASSANDASPQASEPPVPPPLQQFASDTSVPNVPPPPMDMAPLPTPSPRRDSEMQRAAETSAAPKMPTTSEPAWKELQQKMLNQGVVRYEIQGSPGGKTKFRCEIAMPGAPPFEAENEDFALAVQAALKRVVLYKAARKAAMDTSSRPADRSELRAEAAPVSASPTFEPAPAIVRPPNFGQSPIPQGTALSPPPDLPN